jgi:hypothetical protein
MLPAKIASFVKVQKHIDQNNCYWLALWSEDSIEARDLTQGFFKEGHMPVITFRYNNETFIPFFDSNLEAARFAQRNFGKKSVIGTVTLTELIKKEIDERNIHAAHFCFPSKIIELLGIELQPELVSIEKDTKLVPIL